MVERKLELEDLLPGDLLFSHTSGNPYADLVQYSHNTPYSHVGIYYGDGLSLDASPKGGVVKRRLEGLIEPTCSAEEAGAWEGVDDIAVRRHPVIAQAFHNQGPQRAKELGRRICDAANWRTPYAVGMLDILKDAYLPQRAEYRYQHLFAVMTSSEVTTTGVQSALGLAHELIEAAKGFASGYTCSAFVANAFIEAAKIQDDADLGLTIRLPAGGALIGQYATNEMPRLASKPDEIQVTYINHDRRFPPPTAEEIEGYENLLMCLSKLLNKPLQQPLYRVVEGAEAAYHHAGDYVVMDFAEQPETEILMEEIPRFIVGIHHLLHARDNQHNTLEAVGTLFNGARPTE